MSNSRLEKFIYAICSMEVSDLPAPLSRIEILWNCLITGETPDFEPQSRNEQYLMAMLGLYELDQLPTPMSRGEKLLYKIAMGETDLSDIPAYLSRYEELLGYLAENGGVGDFEYILQTLNQRLSTLYSTKERPMKQVVIKGDTLVNELPRPSLKNTMTNAASQKLNQGYDNGKTLVNLVNFKDNYFRTTGTINSREGCTINFTTSATGKFNLGGKISVLETAANYLLKIKLECKNKAITYVYLLDEDNNRYIIPNASIEDNNYSCKFTSPSTIGNTIKLGFIRTTDGGEETITASALLIKYQDGMENWDIPYFEGTKTFSATPNVVDGEFKQAVVKGQTLVNIKGKITNDLSMHNYPKFDFLISLAKKNTDYLIKYDTTLSSGGVLAIGFLRDANTWSKNLENQPNAGILKLNSGENPNYFRIITSPSNTITLNNLMIIEYQEGMENWDIPYFEGMQSVQLSEVTTTGKNLFTGKNMSFGYYRADGIIDDFNHENSLSDYIKVEPSSSYAYKCFSEDKGSNYGEFAFFDENKNFINVLHAHHTSDTCIITPDNCHYLRAWNNQYINNGEIHPNAMLVKTTNLPSTLIYEPYQSNTLTLAEPVNLRKVGEVEDEFDALTGQVTERVGEVVLDGSEKWFIDLQRETYIRYKMLLPHKTKNHSFTISDKLQTITDDNAIKDSVRTSSYSATLWIYKINSTGLDEFKTWLSQNPITVQYQLATPTTKQVNTTITDQDGATQTKLHSFNDGHLSVSSQDVLPSAVNYEVPTNNSYYLPDMLTLGAQYTSRGSADCNATIDGKLLALGKNRTFTTPSSVTDRLMVLDAPVDDLMFIKGDQTSKDFGYFEGMKSVMLSNKMPVLTTTGENLWNGVFLPQWCDTNGGVSDNVNTRIIKMKVEPNTKYTVSRTETGNRLDIIMFSQEPVLGSNAIVGNALNSSTNADATTFTTTSETHWIIIRAIDNVANYTESVEFQIEFGNRTPHEPYKTNILTVNEDIELRGIGDVKDTLDCLTGEVTERIGEIVIDGSDDEQWVQSSPRGDSIISFQLQINGKQNSCNFTNDKIPNKTRWDEPTESLWADNSIILTFNKSSLTTADESGVRQRLSQNPITIQYELATESIKTVDLTTVDQDGQPTKLKTFNDITHVEINADNIIPSVDVEVATKISETLSTLGLDHHDISNTQNQLDQTIDEQTENTDATMMATTEIYEQTL